MRDNLVSISRWKMCVLKERISRLPKKPGLYAILNKNSKRIYYIGKSINLRNRWKWNSSHHRFKQACKLRDPKIAWIEIPKSKIHNLELEYIKKYKPIWNNTPIKSKKKINLKRNLNCFLLGVLVCLCLFLLAM